MNFQGTEIAVIGMACRLPGSKTIQAFWDNLLQGKEAITSFSDEELLAAGVSAELVGQPNYVKAKAFLDDIDQFDAGFFGFTPNEARITDPQQRIFLECAWEALEDAGYAAGKYEGAIGVYAGQGQSNYYLHHLHDNPEVPASVSAYQMLIANNVDFLATRASYKLNLKGPSVTVQTACSTSLVAIHMACQSLLGRECDMALAGGTKITVPQVRGNLYEKGGVTSSDGHCRPFDARAEGFVNGNGSSVVLLKRLEDAQRDRDHIYAIIRGSAINNDGSTKIGFTAPSVDGQAEVIHEAHALGDVAGDSITYLEAHGTATPLGDPIEIAALTKAFRTPKKQFCAIGSVKGNLGHLDAAAGVAGFIKAVLALKHQTIPPSINFDTPNPGIDFANSPFYVASKRTPWVTGGQPRRAGVSSFGMGGTNAHVVLEEAPPVVSRPDPKPCQVVLLSAKTQASLDRASENLKEYLLKHPDVNLADLAHTLQVGRKEFDFRRSFVCADVPSALDALTGAARGAVTTNRSKTDNPPVVFLFPGQGTQYVNMGRDLYAAEPLFREEADRCFAVLDRLNQRGIRELLYPSAEGAPDERIHQTENAQVALFIIEYALAQLLLKVGVRPAAMLGHSLGEYTAACVAGVFSLETALKVLLTRGRLMQGTQPGQMAAVFIEEAELAPFLGDALSLAAVNGPANCVIAGPPADVQAALTRLREKGYESRLLTTSHAFHSGIGSQSFSFDLSASASHHKSNTSSAVKRVWPLNPSPA